MPAWPRLVRWVLLGLIVMATLATAVSGLRSYRSFLLLRSAQEMGVPNVSNIRAWMTLRYVSDTYHAPEGALIGRLGLAPETDPDTSLKSLAEREGQSPFEYVQRVQRAVAEVAPVVSADRRSEAPGWLGAVGDEFLAALLVYGYPVLGLTLLLGAIGLPLPTGLSAAVAGSLVARGSMSWAWAGAIAVTASVLGDVVGYGLGRVLSKQFLERHGRWLGYTPARRVRVESLFHRWGAVGVLLSRTLASHLSAVLNLLAGASRYRVDAFVVFTIAGRFLWTSAYLGLGYGIGGDLEAAAGFLTNLSLFLVSVALLVALGLAGFAQSSIYRYSRLPTDDSQE
ncbi:MAG: VTT domain-containing protein [Betaproteobacteria bacterium]|nr:VTT domain-containing protein [Betaproteobacteria bacterium]